jgi:dTMP kinase
MRLVAIEGIDRSGKTTLTAALARVLTARGTAVATCREPGDGPIGRLFRQLSAGDSHDATMLALLSAAARREQQPVLAKLTTGLVISDRYYLSGLAYHGADGVDPVFYQMLNDGMRRPGLYLFLDLDPAAAAARRRLAAADRWERGHIAAGIAAAYDRALRLVSDTEHAVIARLDAAQPPAAVLGQALAALNPWLTAAREGGGDG